MTDQEFIDWVSLLLELVRADRAVGAHDMDEDLAKLEVLKKRLARTDHA